MYTFHFWLWLCICIVSIILEIATESALVSIWFALGAVIALIATLLGLNFSIQIIIFFITSIALVLLIRPLAAKHARGNTIPTNADRLIQTRAHLIAPVLTDAPGQLKANGLIWNAVSIDGHPIEQGSLVEIVAIEGSKLLVKKI